MLLTFSKYHGTGNDFIMVDAMKASVQVSPDQIITLCKRRFGIGSDGIIFLRPDHATDYHMDFYNPDGSQSFCGNGSRCAFAFARDLGYVSDHASFKAIDGEHQVRMEGANIAVGMKDVTSVESVGDDLFMDTGSPHYLVWTNDLDDLDLVKEARYIRYNQRFRDSGVNVNFVKKENGGIRMRTYERGVEFETFSCGTGVTASSLGFALVEDLYSGEVDVEAPGGKLAVSFERTEEAFVNVWLKGPAVKVFEGSIEL